MTINTIQQLAIIIRRREDNPQEAGFDLPSGINQPAHKNKAIYTLSFTR